LTPPITPRLRCCRHADVTIAIRRMPPFITPLIRRFATPPLRCRHDYDDAIADTRAYYVADGMLLYAATLRAD